MCAALVAAAQDDAFKQGLQARGDKKWADVVRHMQNALKADAQESTRKVRFTDSSACRGMEYLPHFFLGEAYYNQQDCGGAVTEWSISEQQGAIKIKPEFLGTIRVGSQACAAKGVLLAADYTPLYQSTSTGLHGRRCARQAGQRYRHDESRRLAPGSGRTVRTREEGARRVVRSVECRPALAARG